MAELIANNIRVGIACGGTGGHLFPGLALAERFHERGARVVVFVSGKSVDATGLAEYPWLKSVELPGVGFSMRQLPMFLVGLVQGYRVASRVIRDERLDAVIGMGGYVSVPPVLAAKRHGLRTFIHESNAIPGRANRLLAGMVDRVFLGMGPALGRIRAEKVTVVGTPVRSGFVRLGCTAAECRMRLGLAPDRDVLLVMGGSQGARALNGLMLESLNLIARRLPELQIVHLTGSADYARVVAGYAGSGIRHVVLDFSHEMPVILRASTLALARAGASSLAEFAAADLPAVLVPYPYAVDDHQRLNAEFFVRAGGAVLLPEAEAVPERLVALLVELLSDRGRLDGMRLAMGRLNVAGAADRMVDLISQVTCPEAYAAMVRSGSDTVTSGSMAPS